MIAKPPLNRQALTLEETEARIRDEVRDMFFKKTPKPLIDKKIQEIISNALKDITIDSLRQSAKQSLAFFYLRLYREYAVLQPKTIDILTVLGLVLAGEIKSNTDRVKSLRRYGIVVQGDTVNLPNANLYGVPLRKFHEDYMRENVKPVFDRLIQIKPRDPNDVTGRNTLRNLAEMEVRYNDHLQQIADLKAAGNRLVIASTHADCSKRCAHWQGRVYSLDGTSGTTDDGRKFVPLEVATNVPYTTKAGKTYMNGLLGFNCFDKNTEVLTNHGWKLFAELTPEDTFYTLNIETRETEFQNAVNYYKAKYNDKMVRIYSKTTDLCVTPNHNILYFTQKDKRLRFKFANEYSTATCMFAGQEWNKQSPKTIKLGGQEVNTALYCRFMAYYLADGSIHSQTAVKIAQQNNDDMFAELQALPFKVWRDSNKIVIYGKELKEELEKYGKCTEKYIPETIKNLSRKDIQEFLSAFLKTDGYIQKDSYINGKKRRNHLSVFTTSKQMSADLCELALKSGYRPSYTVKKGGRAIKFKNGTYTTNYDCYIIHLNRRVNITHCVKEYVEYNDFIYCVEVPNHTLLVRRNNKVQWCGNCRHFLVPYKSGFKFPKPNVQEERKQYAITLKQRELERNVRQWRTEALTYKGVDREKYAFAKKKAEEWNNAYIEFSRKNERAYYPSRTKII